MGPQLVQGDAAKQRQTTAPRDFLGKDHSRLKFDPRQIVASGQAIQTKGHCGRPKSNARFVIVIESAADSVAVYIEAEEKPLPALLHPTAHAQRPAPLAVLVGKASGKRGVKRAAARGEGEHGKADFVAPRAEVEKPAARVIDQPDGQAALNVAGKVDQAHLPALDLARHVQ